MALSLLRTIAKDSAEQKNKVDLEKLLQPPEVSSDTKVCVWLRVPEDLKRIWTVIIYEYGKSEPDIMVLHTFG